MSQGDGGQEVKVESIYGLVEYSMNTFPVGEIIRKHNFQCHMYADDTQLYVAFDLSSEKFCYTCH